MSLIDGASEGVKIYIKDPHIGTIFGALTMAYLAFDTELRGPRLVAEAIQAGWTVLASGATP